MDDITFVKVLWDYMKMNSKLKKADCIIALGSEDTNIATIAAELYLKGYSDKIIFSGGLGKVTCKLWNETEAERFSKIAIEKGVPCDRIYLEKESTNTGDNFRFSKKIIETENLQVSSCIVVCRPYDEKRVYAAFKKIMPEYEIILYSENITCEEYYERKGKDWIDVLTGDIQRMELFFKKGWQIQMDIPTKVWEAYEVLVSRGYNRFILKDEEDKGSKEEIQKILSGISK